MAGPAGYLFAFSRETARRVMPVPAMKIVASEFQTRFDADQPFAAAAKRGHVLGSQTAEDTDKRLTELQRAGVDRLGRG